MNKTININLAGGFFHIDENAFIKLDRYLKTIESYLAQEESKEEILQDIEARIAELFTESMSHEKQVINLAQVDDMIAIMGEPEAYKIDDEEATTSTSSKFRTSKKLYRDIERNYVGGVSAGLNHYLGLNLFVIRLIWVVSAFFSFGATVAIYIILWAVTPAARTTAQKLDMHGEPVNLTNIERKVKESYSKFADKVGDIDYDKYSQQTKSGATKFFDGLGEVLKAIGVFISKFLGIILLIISGAVLVASLIFLFSFGTISLFELGDFNNIELFSLGIPYWIQVVLFFLVGAIPFFYLLILSLKLLFSNLKSIGKISHITLIGVWILSIIVITTLGVKKQIEVSYDGESVEVNSLSLAKQDTLTIKMNQNLLFSDGIRRSNQQKIVNDTNDASRLYSSNVFVNFRTYTDDELKVRITKKSNGSSETEARQRAASIDYDFVLENSTLKLDNYCLALPEFLKKNIKVEVTVFIPEDKTIYLDKSLMDFRKIRNFRRSDYNTYLSYQDNTWKPTDSIIKQDSITTQN